MGKTVYVGNLDYSVTNDELRDLFEQHGTVTDARVIIDRIKQRSKGFGFVDMATEQEAEDAIEALNGVEHMGRALTVNEARPRNDNRGGDFGGSRDRF